MLVNKTELAKHIGVSPQYITKMSKKWGLTFINGKVDLDEAVKVINDSKDPSRPSQKKDKDDDQAELVITTDDIDFFSMDIQDLKKNVVSLSFNDTRTAREKANLILAKIDLDTKMKDLVERAVIEKQAYEMAKIFKDSLLVIPDRIADQLASEQDSSVIVNILEKELKNCLNELIKTMNAMEF